MPNAHATQAHNERQLDMFALFELASTPVKKKQTRRVFSETDPVQVRLLRLLRYGYGYAEISRLTNIAISTIHFWVQTIPQFKAAQAHGHEHGACQRIIEALYEGARCWEELEEHTGLNETNLGLTLCTLFVKRAIKTRIFVPDHGCLRPRTDGDTHSVLQEVRFYFPGPNANFYYDPPAVNNHVM